MILILKIIIIMYLSAPILSLSTILLEKIYKNKIKKERKSKFVDIYVLLPALKEQKIVKETIDHFSSVKYKGNIKYIIITTEKEEQEYKMLDLGDLTTSKVVEDYLKIKKDKRFLHYHYPKTNGNKSSQLNYAINKIEKEIKDKKNTYISVFDFDSRPDLNTFNDLAKIVSLKKHPNVISQVPLNIKNYKETSNKSILMTIYALQHMVRSLAIEKVKLLITSLTNIKIPQYLMGACMHLRVDTLLENNLFPIFVDDLTLGYRLSIKGYRFAYLPSHNYALIPNDIKGYLGSATLIFKGILTYLNEILTIKKKWFNKFKMFIDGTLNVLQFAVIPFIFVIFYIYSIITLKFNYLFYLMLIIPILWSLSSYIVLKTLKIKEDNKINSFLAIILSPCWFIFRPLGFIKYLIKVLNKKLRGKEITYSKTER